MISVEGSAGRSSRCTASASGGLIVAAGEVSVQAVHASSGVPVTFCHFSATALCVPPCRRRASRRLEKSRLQNSGVVEQRIEQRVDAGDGGMGGSSSLDETRNVARIGDQHVLRADLEEGEAVRREREDVIQRQRRDDALLALGGRSRLDPGIGLSTLPTILRWISIAP